MLCTMLSTRQITIHWIAWFVLQTLRWIVLSTLQTAGHEWIICGQLVCPTKSISTFCYLALDNLRYGMQIALLCAYASSTTTGLLVIFCCPCEEEFLVDDKCAPGEISGSCSDGSDVSDVSDGSSFSG